MGVPKDEIVVHLAMLGTACCSVELLPGLVAAVTTGSVVVDIVGLVTTGLVVVDTVGLVTALLAMLETAELVSEEPLEVVVEVALELVAALRAWKAAALLLSFIFFFSNPLRS